VSQPPKPTDPRDPLAQHSSTAREVQQRIEVMALGEAFVAVRDANNGLHFHVLPNADHVPVTIGRRVGADVLIAWDREVSGVHARLERLSGEWTVVDDGLSTNGTFINGQRSAGQFRLRSGDRIRVGNTVIAFAAPDSEGADQTFKAENMAARKRPTAAQHPVLVALCRPRLRGEPMLAKNTEIAMEVGVEVETVKFHLRGMYELFGLKTADPRERRIRLATLAIETGLVTERDL